MAFIVSFSSNELFWLKLHFTLRITAYLMNIIEIRTLDNVYTSATGSFDPLIHRFLSLVSRSRAGPPKCYFSPLKKK